MSQTLPVVIECSRVDKPTGSSNKAWATAIKIARLIEQFP